MVDKKTYCYCINCGKKLELAEDSQTDCETCGYSNEHTDNRLTWWHEGDLPPTFHPCIWWDAEWERGDII